MLIVVLLPNGMRVEGADFHYKHGVMLSLYLMARVYSLCLFSQVRCAAFKQHVGHVGLTEHPDTHRKTTNGISPLDRKTSHDFLKPSLVAQEAW